MAGGVSRPDKHGATFGGLEKSDLKFVICSFPFSIEKKVYVRSLRIQFATHVQTGTPFHSVPLYPSHKGQFHQNDRVAGDVMTNLSRKK